MAVAVPLSLKSLNKDWFGVSEAAAAVGVDPSYLRRKIRAWTSEGTSESGPDKLRHVEA